MEAVSDESRDHTVSPAIDRGANVNLEKTSHGKLKISLTELGRREFEEFERFRDEQGIHAALIELFAEHLANGRDLIAPEEIAALTAALIISDEADRDDQGRLTQVGHVYWNPSYAVMDEIRELRERGFVLFDRA